WGAGGVGTFMGDGDVVGIVNGEKITTKYFYETYNVALEQYRDAGIKLDAQTTEEIISQTWETVVNQMLWQQEIKNLGITVSDEELFYHLENNPPEFLRTQEVFLTDGEFDKQKYLSVLYNPQGNEWLQIEDYLRNVLPYQKLNDLIMTSVVVDENEVMQKYISQNVNYSVNYISAPIYMIPDSIITVFDDDLEVYYNEQKENNYKQQERRHIRIVSWLKIPSAEDSAAVMNVLDDISLRCSEGESFDELANIFSEERNENMIADLGWFSKDMLRHEYRELVFNAEMGEILQPIIIGDEYHLIKITGEHTEKGVDEVRISLIVRRIDPVNTYDYYATEADAFLLDNEDYGFAKAYENVDAHLDTIKGGFTKEFPYFGNFGYFPTLAKWAYRSKVGDLSPVYNNEKAFLVAELYNIVEASYMPFEDVRSSVERGVIASLKIEKSTDLVEGVYDAIMRGDVSLQEAADASSYIEYKTMSFTLENLSYPFGSSPVFSDVIRNLSVNDISLPFVSGRYGSVFVQLTGKTDVDMGNFAIEREKIMSALLVEKQHLALEKWTDHLKEKAIIKDYRENFGLN
ncbi:MAG: SurA N-terminal domain-containing protein, partial [Candidatus Marinimicrobia bacterium]|nr:SurA N-terminal domain-containing protein [Candidatus Neomarinimicrobiota bacterium]